MCLWQVTLPSCVCLVCDVHQVGHKYVRTAHEVISCSVVGPEGSATQ